MKHVLNIEKLPKWAQDHIATIERERDVAIDALNKHCDDQTKSPFFCDDHECTGEDRGPTIKRRYFQGRRIKAEWRGMTLEIMLVGDGDHQRFPGIQMQWTVDNHVLGLVAMVPTSLNTMQLVTKEDMR